MFKTLNKDNKTNYIFVQGALSRNACNDISGIIFQNYDDDTKKVYDMAGITMTDAFGDSNSDGIGNIIFKTNVNGSNLTENMRLDYMGNLCIGTSNSIEKLTLQGNAWLNGEVTITSNLSVPEIFVSTLAASNLQADNITFNATSIESITACNGVIDTLSNNILAASNAVVSSIISETLAASNISTTVGLTSIQATFSNLVASNAVMLSNTVGSITASNINVSQVLIAAIASNNTLAASNLNATVRIDTPLLIAGIASNNTLAASNAIITIGLTAPQGTITTLTASNVFSSNVTTTTLLSSNAYVDDKLHLKYTTVNPIGSLTHVPFIVSTSNNMLRSVDSNDFITDYGYGSQYHFAKSTTLTATTNAAFTEKLRLTTPSVPTGRYRVAVNFQIYNLSGQTRPLNVRSWLDVNTNVWYTSRIEVAFLNGAATTEIYHAFEIFTLTQGSHIVAVDYASPNGANVGLGVTKIELMRIS